MKRPQFNVYFLPFRFWRAIREVAIATSLFFLFKLSGIAAFESAMITAIIWIAGMVKGILVTFRKRYRSHMLDCYDIIERQKKEIDFYKNQA